MQRDTLSAKERKKEKIGAAVKSIRPNSFNHMERCMHEQEQRASLQFSCLNEASLLCVEDEWQQWKWRGTSANMRRIKRVYEPEN